MPDLKRAIVEALREALRSARSQELDDVAAEFERSANRVEKAKGATERTRYAREVVEVLRNRAQEIRDAD